MSPRSFHVLVCADTTMINVTTIDGGLNAWRKLIGGNLSSLALPPSLRRQGIGAYCNDDGVYLDLPPNRFARQLGHYRLLGPVVFFADHGDGDEHGLSVANIRMLARYLAAPASVEATEMVERDRAFLEANPSGVAFTAFETMDDLLEALGFPRQDAGDGH